MVTRTRTVDLLPEIFRTETNKKFLASTLDQMIQPSKLQQVEGYIGKRNGPGVTTTDSYVLEPSTTRANYQLEPSVVYKVPGTTKTKDLTTYPGLIDALGIRGAKTNKHDRLFSSEFYAWDPFIDYDKFINFSQYYWLAGGSDSVNVQATEIALTNNYSVGRTDSGYTLSETAGTNPTITLVRGGNYTFEVQQTGNPFWIQTNPGTTGLIPGQENQSSREVLGVTNNGDDNGSVQFNVPLSTAQNEFYTMPDVGPVDLATDLKFDQINNVYVDVFLEKHGGIDSISDLDNRTVIFLNKNTDSDSDKSGWRITDRFDSTTAGYDSEVFDSTTDITTQAQRYSVWKIKYLTDTSDPTRPYITLSKVIEVPQLNKLEIQYGTLNASKYYYKSAEGYFEQQPLLTATRDILYYQDQNDSTKFGVINIVDEVDMTLLNVNDIIGKTSYTSPNGVTFTNGMQVQFRGRTEPSSYQDQKYYVEGVGTAIELLAVDDFKTPEPFLKDETLPFDSTAYDFGAYDSSLNSPQEQDYFTINRASKDLNPWTRTNRWVHVDVINKSAEYNDTIANLDQSLRAKRPIIEFKAGLKLFNFGTESKAPVNIIDFNQTDALSNVNGKTGYSLDGYDLVDGTRIIFAADTDSAVRNKIYNVTLIDQDDDTTTAKIINLTEANDGTIVADNNIYVLSGATLQGKSYRYTGTEWIETQQKTKVNQAPLFDMFDSLGNSLGSQTTYPSTNFTGTKLFSYALGSGAIDTVLNQRLNYLNINNVGDIVFDNNLESDTFTYTKDSTSTTSNINVGFVHNYSDRTTFEKELGWKKHINKSIQRQILSFTYANEALICDVPVKDATENPLTIYVDNKFYSANKYSYTTTTDQTTITFGADYTPAVGASIQVQIISDLVSKIGFYQVPDNLANNSPNETFTTVTLGTVRNHYVDLAQNIPSLSGTVLGINNIRDLGDVVPYGNKIVQQGSPIQLATTFVRDSNINFFDALSYAGTEYEKYKNKLIDAVVKNDFQGTIAQKLDKALKYVNQSKEITQPFYWTDTIACGDVFTETKHTITAIDDEFFDLLDIYDFTKANYKTVLVYKNDVQLIRDIEYTVATDAARLTIHNVATGLPTLVAGDVIKIREYETTYGSYVPSTPTKLGLYRKFTPEIYSDDSYVTATNVILGHDGSKTLAWGDDRDNILLEFEKRIYNNIKWSGDVPLCLEDVQPGKFRTTDYTDAEITEILGTDFLTWVSWNRLDYKTQDYVADDQQTWNYSKADDTINSELLLGHWRGIFNNYYDTDIPHLRPWELIGFSQQPIWWVSKYGPAPYTSGNEVLWDDLAGGKIWDGVSTYTVESKFKRPELTQVIPVDDEGNLKTAFDVMVRNYDNLSLNKSWVVGDQGPVETAWKRSSSFPFAVMRLIALTKPAEFFALNADRDLYKYDTALGQYLYNGRTRIKSSDISVYGENNPKHSYINWSVDFARKQGISTSTEIKETLANINIQLTYRMASFSDKEYLKIFTEKTSPNSNNTSLLFPDESYEVFLYNNEIFDQVEFSSIIIQKTADGYAVYGNSKLKPYFTIFTSLPNGNFKNIKVGNTEVRVSSDFSDTEVKIPYGYVFTNTSTLSDFIISYGRWLESKGYVFEARENNYILDWYQMIREALYWSQQGWREGSIINLNPNANKLYLQKEQAVVAPILGQGTDDFILNQNLKGINNDSLVFNRLDNIFEVKTTDENAIAYINAKFTSYEHVLVFDNVSIFNDLIYDPTTGSRQQRLKINGYSTGDWNGQVDAQGFVFNLDNVAEWSGTSKYSKGDIVFYKNQYYSAADRVPPSDKFNYTLWLETEYEQIKKGLLPNLSLKSDQLRDYYNSNVANLENDADQLGFGLIGFNKRDYLENMNLDDISQVNVYQNFTGSKGTKRAVDLFKSAKLEKELTDYNVYENWAVKQGVYGANANRSYIELELNESLLTSNPSTVKLATNDSDTTKADQTVNLESIYRQSFKINTTPLTTAYYSGVNSELSLPTAGYANIDDVNIQAFDLDELSELTAKLDQVKEGTTVWVAKDNSHEWNIYRVGGTDSTLLLAKDNLDGTTTFTFNKHHKLAKNDLIVIKLFGTDVDSAYRVQSIPSVTKITVSLSLPTGIDSLTGEGLLFKLNSIRVAQPSDVLNLPFAKSLNTGNRVWVDNNGDNLWTVLEKTSPFTAESNLVTNTPLEDTNFGSSVAQNLNNLTALIGADNHASGRGSVYSYVKTADDVYAENSLLTLASVTGVTGYGNDIAFADETYAVAGASTSNGGQGYAVVIKQPNKNLLTEHQLLVTPDGNPTSLGNFGDAVAISQNGRMIYVGAPGKDRVYGYQKIDRQLQRATFIGDGSTVSYDVSDYIISAGNQEDQITVVVGTTTLAVSDYNFAGDVVTLDTAAKAGQEVNITRNETIMLAGDGSTTQFDITGLYTVDGLHSIQVFLNGTLQRPELDYSYEADSSLTFEFITAPTNGASIEIRSSDYYEHIITIAGNEGERFGDSVSTTTDGRQIIIGAPLAESNSISNVGKVYIYDRDVQRIQQTVTGNKTFTVEQTPQGRAEVYVNNVYQTNSTYYIGGTYTFTTKTATLATAPLLGDFVEIETNNVQLVDTIEMTNANQSAGFGSTVKICPTNCSVYASAPTSNQEAPESGSVTRAVNQSRLYGTITGTVANPTVTSGHKIRINNYVVEFTNTTLAQVVIDINNSNIPNVVASATTDNKLTISLINVDAGEVANRLYVLPASSGATPLTDLGLDIFAVVQTIENPYPKDYTNFGHSISVSSDALTLVVGSPTGQSNLEVTLDAGKTTLDSDLTELRDISTQSGVAYTFDYLSSANDSISNPGKLVFGQQVVDRNVDKLSKFGNAVDYKSGKLLITSPGHKNATEQVVGRLTSWNNATRQVAWKVIRKEEPVVDVALLNTAWIYDKNDKETKVELDFIDPIQGKILGAVKQNLDIIGAEDPASYNTGTINNNGMTWNDEYVGKVWWNTTNARFINHYQGDVNYRSKAWAQLFTGSSIDVYQWVESSQPPADYVGEGTVYSTTSYSTNTRVGSSGNIETVYYFWIKDIAEVAQEYNKTLSVKTMSEYILDPKSSGISYMAPVEPGTVALYNTKEYLVATDRILHVEFDKTSTENNVHVEYELIKTSDPTEFLSATLYRKFIDSFAGVDNVGFKVPDSKLSLAESYGVEYRPRQSMFADRFLALKNYITRANRVFSKYPISEMRELTLLNSQENEPVASSGTWNKRLLTYDELTYQNLILVPTGYRYLVANDSTNNGLWTIYEVQADDSLLLIRVQNYKTSNLWAHADWYATGYSVVDKPTNEVATYSRLATLESTTAVGELVQVTANSNNKREIYVRTATGWDRVSLQDGTIKISDSLYDYSDGRKGFDNEVFDAQYFDAEPVIETRQIIKAINDELLINELASERIGLITLMFEYIKSEQTSVNWLVKTSLVDIEHTLRDLQEYDIYQVDNQEFVEKYINEVKPYHVQVKEFNLKYQGEDLFKGDTTDFDLPSYYDTGLAKFVSPKLSTDGLEGSFLSTDPIWTTWPYSQWNANHTLSIDSVNIVNGGSGYTSAPTVTVTGTATTPATFKAIVNTAGVVTSVEVVTAGAGYTTTPTLTISGGSGTGATAIAVTSPGTVRSYKTTIKYDRYEYESEIVDWTAGTSYEPGTLVRNNNKVYEVKNEEDSALAVQGDTFDPDDFTLIDASTLSGVNRTMGLYVPAENEPGLDLSLLISGTDYPGVQVQGPLYSQNTGYDVGNFDINPWGNLDFGEEGEPSYSETILDTKYRPGDYTDTYLGTLASDINVDGGAFIDTYSSHSPEELVPGSIFDTLNMKVFTRPGFDYDNDGHSAPFGSENWVYDGTADTRTVNFDKLVTDPFAVRALNITTGLSLRFEYVEPAVGAVDYTIDWLNKTLTFTGTNINSGDILRVESYGIGGGNQLWVDNYSVTDHYVDASTLVYIDVPVNFDEIYEAMIKCNGSRVTNYTFSEVDEYTTRITFGTSGIGAVKYFGTEPLETGDYLHVCIMGYEGDESSVPGYITHDESLVHTSSHPSSQIIDATGATTYSLDQDFQKFNPYTAIVEVDGVRLTPPEGLEYTSDGSSAGPFYLNVGNWKSSESVMQSLIADNDVHVFVDDIELKLYEDFTISPIDDSSVRYVALTVAPAVGASIRIFVETAAQYKISYSGHPVSADNKITFNTAPSIGTRVLVTSDNDTSELDLINRIYKGPVSTGITTVVGYDGDDFDESTFDETVGSVTDLSIFELDRVITKPDRLQVTVNGLRKYYGKDWKLNQNSTTSIEFLGSSQIGDLDVVVVRMQSENVAPDKLNFALFKDMRNVNAVYNINKSHVTTVTQAVTADADTITVLDASKLSTPDLANNLFGIVMIDGERITYRNIDITNNTISGLRRGTAGTAASTHAVGEVVYDYSVSTYLNYSYNKTWYEAPLLADGSAITNGKALQNTNTVPAKFLKGQ